MDANTPGQDHVSAPLFKLCFTGLPSTKPRRPRPAYIAGLPATKGVAIVFVVLASVVRVVDAVDVVLVNVVLVDLVEVVEVDVVEVDVVEVDVVEVHKIDVVVVDVVVMSPCQRPSPPATPTVSISPV